MTWEGGISGNIPPYPTTELCRWKFCPNFAFSHRTGKGRRIAGRVPLVFCAVGDSGHRGGTVEDFEDELDEIHSDSIWVCRSYENQVQFNHMQLRMVQKDLGPVLVVLIAKSDRWAQVKWHCWSWSRSPIGGIRNSRLVSFQSVQSGARCVILYLCDGVVFATTPQVCYIGRLVKMVDCFGCPSGVWQCFKFSNLRYLDISAWNISLNHLGQLHFLPGVTNIGLCNTLGRAAFPYLWRSHEASLLLCCSETNMSMIRDDLGIETLRIFGILGY